MPRLFLCGWAARALAGSVRLPWRRAGPAMRGHSLFAQGRRKRLVERPPPGSWPCLRQLRQPSPEVGAPTQGVEVFVLRGVSGVVEAGARRPEKGPHRQVGVLLRLAGAGAGEGVDAREVVELTGGPVRRSCQLGDVR